MPVQYFLINIKINNCRANQIIIRNNFFFLLLIVYFIIVGNFNFHLKTILDFDELDFKFIPIFNFPWFDLLFFKFFNSLIGVMLVLELYI